MPDEVNLITPGGAFMDDEPAEVSAGWRRIFGRR
jgi:hypothetical protein